MCLKFDDISERLRWAILLSRDLIRCALILLKCDIQIELKNTMIFVYKMLMVIASTWENVLELVFDMINAEEIQRNYCWVQWLCPSLKR